MRSGGSTAAIDATVAMWRPITREGTRFTRTMSELDGRSGEPRFIAGLAAGERASPTAGQPARFEMGGSPEHGVRRRSTWRMQHLPRGLGILVSRCADAEGGDASRLHRTMRVLATSEGQAVQINESASQPTSTTDVDRPRRPLERTHLGVPRWRRRSVRGWFPSCAPAATLRRRMTIVPLHPQPPELIVDIDGWWMRIVEWT